MANTLTRNALRKAKAISFYVIAALAVLFLCAVAGDLMKLGEQNLPAWALVIVMYTLPAWIGAIVVAAFVSAYISERRRITAAWPAEDSTAYRAELEEVKKHLAAPMRVDMYSRKTGMGLSEVERQIGCGKLKGYVYKGRLFIDDN